MLWAVLMAGGSGTRFWPESRKNRPKQFLKIFGKRTLLEETAGRLSDVVAPSKIWVVTQSDKVSEVKRLLKKIPSSQIVGEPIGRNTAPCAILAASLALRKDPQAVLALLPADHHIGKPARFRRALEAAYEIARQKKLPVTFGIKPDFPHTGYGYLELGPRVILRPSGRRISGQRSFASLRMINVYHVKRFHEKPTLSKAESFLKNRRFLWNSGMFVWQASALLEAAKRYLPRAYAIAQKIVSEGNLKRGLKKLYPQMPTTSMDYGLMEKMRGRILTLPVDIGWKDLGGWHSLTEFLPQDACENVALGKTLLVDSTGNIVRARHRLVALLGVDDHVVIDTEDALLICPREKTEAIRKIVEKLKENKWKKYL